MVQTKIVALDDDPTGCQTVHGCLLLTRWDVDTLVEALLDDAPLFFVLTNTRAMNAAQAAAVTREVCRNLKQALSQLEADGKPVVPVVVSRSDSTLRGHYPVETDIIAEELGPFDAHFLVPAFFEGGRITRDSVHYLKVDGIDTPVHETEFARDSVFGFKHSYLPDYVEEKTAGRIKSGDVKRFQLDDVRGQVLEALLSLRDNQCCVVDGEDYSDLDNFCRQLMAAAGQGKRFLFRSAASLLKALAQLPPQPVAAEDMGSYTRGGKPGVVLVGSHVSKTTSQLTELLNVPGMVSVEINVDEIVTQPDTLMRSTMYTIATIHQAGSTPVVFTSRQEKTFADQAERLAFGERVSSFLMAIVQQLPVSIGYLVSKGGITSNDVLSTGLELRTARVLGQVLAGCSVVRCPDNHPYFPGLPVVIFPGNVGDEQGLADVVKRLSATVDKTQLKNDPLVANGAMG